jgi:hypothetical protein
MNLAQAAWESGDARRTLDLLRHWAPKPGEEDLRGFEWHYWNRQAHQEKRTVRLEGLTPRDRAMGVLGGLSPDGTRAAGAVNVQNQLSWTLRAWDATSGRELWRSAPVRGGFESCVFSDDGRRLLTVNHVGTGNMVSTETRVWEIADGKLIIGSLKLPWHRSSPLLADGERLVASMHGGKADNLGVSKLTGVQILRVSDGKELARIRLEPVDPAHAIADWLAFSPDERYILLLEYENSKSNGGTQRLCLQEKESGRRIWSQDLAEYIKEAMFFPGGDRLVIRVFSLQKGEALIVLDARDGRRLSSHPLPELRRVSYFGEQTVVHTSSRFATVQNSRALVFALDPPAEAGDGALATFPHETDLARFHFRATVPGWSLSTRAASSGSGTRPRRLASGRCSGPSTSAAMGPAVSLIHPAPAPTERAGSRMTRGALSAASCPSRRPGTFTGPPPRPMA